MSEDKSKQMSVGEVAPGRPGAEVIKELNRLFEKYDVHDDFPDAPFQMGGSPYLVAKLGEQVPLDAEESIPITAIILATHLQMYDEIEAEKKKHPGNYQIAEITTYRFLEKVSTLIENAPKAFNNELDQISFPKH